MGIWPPVTSMIWSVFLPSLSPLQLHWPSSCCLNTQALFCPRSFALAVPSVWLLVYPDIHMTLLTSFRSLLNVIFLVRPSPITLLKIHTAHQHTPYYPSLFCFFPWLLFILIDLTPGLLQVPPDFLSNNPLATLQPEWPAQSLNLMMLLPFLQIAFSDHHPPPMNGLGVCPKALIYLGLTNSHRTEHAISSCSFIYEYCPHDYNLLERRCILFTVGSPVLSTVYDT